MRGRSRPDGCIASTAASSPSATWLWGISKRGPHPIEVIASNSRTPRGSIRVHRSRCLTAEDRALHAAVPVTSPARTFLDCAAAVPGERLRRFLERGEELELFDLREIEAALARATRHPGRGPLREAIALYEPPSFSRSTTEPRLHFAVELDLYETHGSRAAFERDRERQEDLKLAGIEMVRITGRRLEREPEEAIARLARMLAQRAAELPSPTLSRRSDRRSSAAARRSRSACSRSR